MPIKRLQERVGETATSTPRASLLMPFPLTEQNAVVYLANRRLITPAAAQTATAQALGGGVSNIVVSVAIPGDPDGTLVLKQSLPRLRVAQEWLADRERVYRESASLRYLAGVLPTGLVPRVLYEDRDNFLFVMTAAPRHGVNWKDALLSGHIDAAVAGQVGDMLGAIHRHSAVTGNHVSPALQQFADQHCFIQLRIAPYHRATAAVHPDLADTIETEAQRMLNRRLALVHGDYSPKNIIVSGAGASARAFLLDFEVAHLGNPVFDLAFMLNHLTLKAIHRPELAQQYNAAARSFWSAYRAAGGGIAAATAVLERETVRQLGVLLLARIDGKSPAEYITGDEQKRRARRLARVILAGDIASLDELHRRLQDP